MAELLFYLLAAGAVAAAVGVVASKNPLFSVMSLLGALFCVACIYLLAGFQFLAVTQLLVYAGAIMVLFLFVIMLLNLGDEEQYAERPATLGKRRLAIAGGSAGALLLLAVFSVGLKPVQGAGGDAAAAAPEFVTETGLDDLHSIGELLFSRYVVAFEASSLLLLATMIAVILLAKRQRGRPGGAKGARRESAGYPWQKGAE